MDVMESFFFYVKMRSEIKKSRSEFRHSKKSRTFAAQTERIAIGLFHGVMVSTRVFGTLSSRSSRLGTTEKVKLTGHDFWS